MEKFWKHVNQKFFVDPIKALPWACAVSMICLILYYFYPSPPSSVRQEDRLGVDTFIPKGFVLVPIEIANAEALDGVFGQYGIVDLYSHQESNRRRGRLLASAVKMLRAPLDPNQFAVLVPEAQSPQFVMNEGGFFVVLHNQQRVGARFEKPIVRAQNPAVIEYAEDTQ